jgi:hypothetical protein
MALSDACFDFLEALREAAQELAERSTRYSHSPIGYGEEIDALTIACREVQASPWNEDAAIRLVKLAGSILGYYDTVPGSADLSGRLNRMNALVRIVRNDLGDAEADQIAILAPELVADTPKAEGAALRLKPILSRLGKVAYEMAIKIVSDVASETVKKICLASKLSADLILKLSKG